jgi:hypothetical protein
MNLLAGTGRPDFPQTSSVPEQNRGSGLGVIA